MTKLPPDGERVIRQLDDFDDAADADPQMKWLEREPYLTRGRWLLSAMRAYAVHKALRPLGLLEYAPPERKRRPWHPLDLVVNDVRRVREIWKRDGQKQQRRDDKVTAGLVAAERHLRIIYGKCTINMHGEGDDDEVELHDMVDKVHRRMQDMGGATGAERNRRKQLPRQII